MITIVLSACPVGLRGDLTKWLLEISSGVFVGKVSARVRDMLWDRVLELCNEGRAIMVYPSATEQGFSVRTHLNEWRPVDFDGLTLMKRIAASNTYSRRKGFSQTSNARRARRPSWADKRGSFET